MTALAIELERLHDLLARIRAGKFGKPVYRATPGCTRRCPRCDVACAVTTGRIHDIEARIASAPTAPRRNPFHIEEAGHA